MKSNETVEGAWSRVLANRVEARLAALEPLLNLFTDLTSPLQIFPDSNGVYFGLDITALSNVLPSGTTFRIYVSGSIFPIEAGANFTPASNKITITGADNAGAARTDLTFDVLPDGGNYFFAGDTFTFNLDVWNVTFNTWNISNSTITFNTTVITIGPTSIFVMAGYTVQTPGRQNVTGTIATFDPSTVQWLILGGGANTTLRSIAVPPAPADGRFLEITNETGKTVVLNDEDAGEAAAARIVTPNGADWLLYDGESVFLKYDGNYRGGGSGRWVILATLPHYRVNNDATDPSAYFQRLNIVGGSGITVTGAGSVTDGEFKVSIALTTPTDTDYYQTVQVDGVAQTQRSILDLIAGANITLTPADDAGGDRTKVTIAAAGGGGTTGTNGQANLASDYTVTTSWADTGLHITLPAAGTYAIDYTAVGVMIQSPPSTAIGTILCKLYDNTLGSDVAQTIKVACHLDIAFDAEEGNAIGIGGARGTAACSIIYTVAGMTELQLWAECIPGAAASTAIRGSGTDGSTSIRYIRLS